MTSGTHGQLKRDLGRIESYATLVGILVGAGVFRVTSEAWGLTGSSVILGYLVLAPAVLATSVPYAVFLSTPLGRMPGGEYTHISRTFGSPAVAFVGVWLKIISYLGALAFLANAFADYMLQFGGTSANTGMVQLAVALGVLLFFYVFHALGIRWYGSVQVAMFVILALSILVLVVPGLFHIEPAHYEPLFSGGARGFASALPPLFFAYAGFESLAQTAGEVRDSTRQLPGVFLRGVMATTLIFVSMSIVAFGVLPGEQLRTSTAPMADVAQVYLPGRAAWIVTLGALMAIATSVNATMLVPSRLTIMLARDGLAPRWLGRIAPQTRTPVVGLSLTFALAAVLLVSRQITLVLHIAVLALVILYLAHSVALLVLPRTNPELFRSRTVRLPLWLQRASAVVSIAAMAILIAVIVHGDVRAWRELSFKERVQFRSLTSLELLLAWSALGVVLYGVSRGRRRSLGPAESLDS